MDALDRELAAAFSVDPSPEFLARVRARVAMEPEPSWWSASRMMLAAGALAVVVLAVSVGRVDHAPVAAQPRPVVLPVTAIRAHPAVSQPARRHRARKPLPASAIQMVSIDNLPTAAIGTVVPAMAFDVVTLTGVHQ